LLTPAEVAALFRVDPKTVWRWSREGRLDSIRTAGGHRRFRQSVVRALLAGAARPTAGGAGERGSGGAAPGSPSPVVAADPSLRQEAS
jgi:excisionase family DNA binding protein